MLLHLWWSRLRKFYILNAITGIIMPIGEFAQKVKDYFDLNVRTQRGIEEAQKRNKPGEVSEHSRKDHIVHDERCHEVGPNDGRSNRHDPHVKRDRAGCQEQKPDSKQGYWKK